MKKRIAILGSTGSIGTQTLQVIEEHRDLFEVELLTANNNVEMLANQVEKFSPNCAIICNRDILRLWSGLATVIPSSLPALIPLRTILQVQII